MNDKDPCSIRVGKGMKGRETRPVDCRKGKPCTPGVQTSRLGGKERQGIQTSGLEGNEGQRNPKQWTRGEGKAGNSCRIID